MTETTEGYLSVSRIYKENRVITETSDEELIKVRSYPPSVPIAKVGVESSLTINMDNFESVKLGVSCVLPCCVEEMSDAYNTAKSFVDTRISEEAAGVREFRDIKRAEKKAKKGS